MNPHFTELNYPHKTKDMEYKKCTFISRVFPADLMCGLLAFQCQSPIKCT